MATISTDSFIKRFESLSSLLDAGNIEKANKLFDDLKAGLPSNLDFLQERVHLILAPLNDPEMIKIKASTTFTILCKHAATDIRLLAKSIFNEEEDHHTVDWQSPWVLNKREVLLARKCSEFDVFSSFCLDWSRNLPFIQSVYYYLRSQAQRALNAEQFSAFDKRMIVGFKDFFISNSTVTLIEAIQNLYLIPLNTRKDKPSARHIILINSIIRSLNTSNKNFLLLTPFFYSQRLSNIENQTPPHREIGLYTYATLHHVAELVSGFQSDFRAIIGNNLNDNIRNHVNLAFPELELIHLNTLNLRPDFKQNLIAHYSHLHESCKQDISQLEAIDYLIGFIKRQFIPALVCDQITDVLNGNRSENTLEFLAANSHLYKQFVQFLDRFSKDVNYWERISQKIEFFNNFVLWIKTTNLKELEAEYDTIEIPNWPEFINKHIAHFCMQCKEFTFGLNLIKKMDETTKKQRKSLTLLFNLLQQSIYFTKGVVIPYVKICKTLFIDNAAQDLSAPETAEMVDFSQIIEMIKYKSVKYEESIWRRQGDGIISIIKTNLAKHPDSTLQERFDFLNATQQEQLILQEATLEDLSFVENLYNQFSKHALKKSDRELVPHLRKTLTRLKKQKDSERKITDNLHSSFTRYFTSEDSKSHDIASQIKCLPFSMGIEDLTLSSMTRSRDIPQATIGLKETLTSKSSSMANTHTFSRERSATSTSSISTTTSKTAFENPFYSIETYISFLQEKIIDSLHVLYKDTTPKIGLKESIGNAKNHIENCLVLFSRFHNQMVQQKTSKYLFATIANFTAEVNLSVELLLLALSLHHSPSIANQAEYMSHVPHNHDLVPILSRLEHSLPLITNEDKDMILEINYGEINSRKLAHFVMEDRDQMTQTQKLLKGAFNCAQQKSSFIPILKMYTDYCHSAFRLIFKLSASMNSTKASPGRNLEIMETYFNSYFQELDSLAQIPVSSVKPLLILTDRSETSTSSSTDNQITVLARIEEIYKIIFELNLTNRVYYCAPKFANILNNLLPRLQVEIERQAELTPAEIRIHYSNVLLLNQYIAEELADIYLTYNGKISLFAGNNHDLHARLVALGYATNLSGLENFCSSGNNIRNVIRYYADQTRFSSISGDVSKAKRHLKASSHSIHSSSTTSTSTVDGFIPVISKQTKMFLEMQKHALDNTLQLANLIELITTMKTH